MKLKRISFLVVLLSLCISFSLSAAVETKDFEKTIDFKSNGSVSVKTVNGKITIVSWNKSSVKIKAEIEVKADSRREAREILDKVEIIIEKRSDRLTIEPDYPKRRKSSFWGRNRSNPKVNFTIMVPKETNLRLRSTNGGIEVEDIEGEFDFRTVNGGIFAEDLLGSVDAATTNGSINIDVGKFENRDVINLKTTNGSIRLTLPSNIKADFEASTVNGSVKTDFPITIQGYVSRKRLEGEINGGGGRIGLSTVNGSIKINEQ